MIDWYSLGFSALWIIGLSVETAGLSLASYLGCTKNWRFRQTLKTPTCRILINLGLVFFCLGLAGVVSTAWEHLLWAVLALIFAELTWQTRKMGNS